MFTALLSAVILLMLVIIGVGFMTDYQKFKAGNTATKVWAIVFGTMAALAASAIIWACIGVILAINHIY